MLQVVAGQIVQAAYDSARQMEIPSSFLLERARGLRSSTLPRPSPSRVEPRSNSDTGVCNDQTKLVDNLVRVGGGQGFFHVTTTGCQSVIRITGITFTGVGGLTTTMNNGAVRFFGNSTQVRLDHCHFTGFLRHSNYFVINGHCPWGFPIILVIDQLPPQFGQQRADNGGGNGDIPFTQTCWVSVPRTFGSWRIATLTIE